MATIGKKQIGRSSLKHLSNKTEIENLIVKNITQEKSYSSAVTSQYYEDLNNKFDNLERGVIPMETNVDNYNDNMRRSLTVWAPLDTTVPQMIEALQKIFGDNTDQQVIGIERDSRVRSISIINIILSTEIACEHLSSQGILLKEKRFYPKPTRPRPPPSNRGYLPNFPVAANKSDLEEAAIELGISVLKIEPRVFRNSTIKIGGWTLWADIDSPTPDVLCFDGQKTPSSGEERTEEANEPNL